MLDFATIIRTTYAALAATLMAASASASATANNDADENYDVIWAVSNAQPFHNVEGYLKDQGLCDQMLLAFQEVMPEVKQLRRVMPPGRISADIHNDENLCVPCSIKNGSFSDVAVYSDVTHEYPPHGIITRPELVETFTKRFGNPLDLELLLQDTSFLFAQPRGRRFGTLQPLLDKYVTDTNRHTYIHGNQATSNILSMVNAKRLDYVIDYPMIMNYHTQILPFELAFIPIKQVIGETIRGAVACTDNEWGHNAVDAINRNLPALQSHPLFKNAKQRWLPAKNN